jgi:hypothetical protein
MQHFLLDFKNTYLSIAFPQRALAASFLLGFLSLFCQGSKRIFSIGNEQKKGYQTAYA